MLIRFFSRSLVILLLVVSPISMVLADEDDRKEIVCLTTHYAPYTIFREEQRDFVGRDMIYINKLANKLNWNLKVLNFPWARLKQEIKSNQFDCFFSLARQQEREKYLSYTDYPLHTTQYGVFFKKGDVQVKEKNLANKIVGVLRGIPLGPSVTKHHELAQANIVYIDSNEILLSIIMTGRVDASVLNYEVGHYLLEDSPFKSEIDSFIVDEYELPVFIAFRKGTQDINVINAALREVMLESDEAIPTQ